MIQTCVVPQLTKVIPISYSFGLTVMGCWLGDVNAGVNWIETGSALGLAIINNRFGSGNHPDTSVKVTGVCQGLTIMGNRLGSEIGVDFEVAGCRGVFIAGNDFQGTGQHIKDAGPQAYVAFLGNNNVSNLVDYFGVGNAVSATSLGKVAQKVEIYDRNGVSLGFIPVYDQIT